MARRAPWRLVLASLLCAAPAGAQELQLLPESQWGKLPASAAGQAWAVEARWDEIFGEKVILWRCEALRGVLVVPKGSPIQERLVRNRDTPGEQLVPKKSRIRLECVAVAQGQTCQLQVKRVLKLPDDVDVQREKLGKAGSPEAIAALVDETKALAERWDDEELRGLVKEMVAKELSARRGALKPGDVAGAEALGLRMLEVGDRGAAIQVLGEAERAATGPVRERLRTRLASLGAVETSSAWLSRPDWLRKEGYIERGGQWVKAERVELELAREAELDRQSKSVGIELVRGNGHACWKAAEQGKIERGQTMAEVHLAAGLPVRAAHADAPDRDKRPARWSQWVLADGRRVYFLNGEVISIRAADQPLPGP